MLSMQPSLPRYSVIILKLQIHLDGTVDQISTQLMSCVNSPRLRYAIHVLIIIDKKWSIMKLLKRICSINSLLALLFGQIDYILGKNPRKMSYVVGFGDHYPRHVHHRGASIPKNKIKYNCKGGWKWRDSKKPNPNTLVGAMVAGPDKHDGFHDVRTNYNYTEPTLAGNAGLVAALVALSGDKSTGIDKNTIFSAVPPMFPTPPPPPAPWKP